jgi:nucleoside-diphosphate-sugar epimerase
MTKILILGGGGMVGQKLANHLLASGLPGHKALDITLFDMAFPLKQDGRLRCITGSLTDAQNITMLAQLRPDIVFHLASIVSGEAEINFDAGWQVNMFTMWHYLEALKALHIESNRAYVPKIIFTSSIAVFGGPFPEQIDDTFLSAPQTSYGAQKASCELLLSDFSRKGFVDGISLRLPTICVRPGKANLAASSFFSGIIREPLNGQKAILPVDESVRHWHASPRAAAGFLRHAATLDSGLLENRRALNLPGVSCTVAEQIEALRRAAGQSVIKLIERQPDDTIINIVSSWPRNFTAKRARALGFQAEASFDEIIATYIQDDLPNASKASAD